MSLSQFDRNKSAIGLRQNSNFNSNQNQMFIKLNQSSMRSLHRITPQRISTSIIEKKTSIDCLTNCSPARKNRTARFCSQSWMLTPKLLPDNHWKTIKANCLAKWNRNSPFPVFTFDFERDFGPLGASNAIYSAGEQRKFDILNTSSKHHAVEHVNEAKSFHKVQLKLIFACWRTRLVARNQTRTMTIERH